MTQECFFHCEKCGKRLIKRLPNGLFHFVYGKRRGKNGDFITNKAPVDILIYGSIKMRCMVDGCNHWSVFNYFPNNPVITTTEVDDLGEEAKVDKVDNSTIT